jgi:hypothetical protein
MRGPHVHHCSEGTLVMTPATCLPQPHQVVLSGGCQVLLHRMTLRGGELTARVAGSLLAHVDIGVVVVLDES